VCVCVCVRAVGLNTTTTCMFTRRCCVRVISILSYRTELNCNITSFSTTFTVDRVARCADVTSRLPRRSDATSKHGLQSLQPAHTVSLVRLEVATLAPLVPGVHDDRGAPFRRRRCTEVNRLVSGALGCDRPLRDVRVPASTPRIPAAHFVASISYKYYENEMLSCCTRVR
jgi:hypothetical protein